MYPSINGDLFSHSVDKQEACQFKKAQDRAMMCVVLSSEIDTTNNEMIQCVLLFVENK